uniref:Uncharacterized protein n=1 Tax=Glossina pallidipes TaxID=7398 RepID=A0A1A9ZXE4_GLOPL
MELSPSAFSGLQTKYLSTQKCLAKANNSEEQLNAEITKMLEIMININAPEPYLGISEGNDLRLAQVERFGSFISSNALRIVSIPSSSLRLRPKRSYISCGINGAPSSRKNCFSKLVIEALKIDQILRRNDGFLQHFVRFLHKSSLFQMRHIFILMAKANDVRLVLILSTNFK